MTSPFDLQYEYRTVAVLLPRTVILTCCFVYFARYGTVPYCSATSSRYQGWEYLGTHQSGKSYLVVSYLGKDKSYLVSKLVVCIVVSPALTGKTYVSRILGRILGRILVLPAQIPPVCGCATSSSVPLLKRCWGRVRLI